MPESTEDWQRGLVFTRDWRRCYEAFALGPWQKDAQLHRDPVLVRPRWDGVLEEAIPPLPARSGRAPLKARRSSARERSISFAHTAGTG